MLKTQQQIIKNTLAVAVIMPLLASCSTLGSVSERPIYAKTNGKAPYVAPRPITEKRKFGTPYTIMGQRYYPLSSSEGYVEEGVASWYGADFHNKKTANGETYNMYDMTAAHTSLPIPTFVRVTNLENGRAIIVRVNDRGPFVKNRVIDLSYRAAVELGMHEQGTANVRLEALPTDGSPLLRSGSVMLAQAESEQNIEPIKPIAESYTPIVHKSSGFTHRIAAKNAPATEVVAEETVEVVDNSVTENNKLYAQVGYYIQTGAFSTVENAQRQVSSLSRFVEGANVYEYNTPDRSLFRVRIGPLKTQAEADLTIGKLVDNGHSGYRIVIEGQ